MVDSTWQCAAIDHGVAIFPNGKIGPCCQISADYLKSIDELSNPHRFEDLHTTQPPPACNKCAKNEYHNIPSYRKFFNSRYNPDKPGFQFVDIRNTNLCNLHCRYCGPHFSSQWSDTLDKIPVIQHQELDSYKSLLITDSLQWMYFTGGEPLISTEHWDLLEHLISVNKSADIALCYNTNLTTLKFKNKNIIDIWKNFQKVDIQCSIDAVGKPLEYIRSGSSWSKIESNLKEISTNVPGLKINISLSPVLSILNIWFIDELFEYASAINMPIKLNVLTGPDYLALDVIPDALKSLALEKVNNLEKFNMIDPSFLLHIKNLINNNINQCLFTQTVSHVLLLDKIKNESLFDLLPFKSLAVDTFLRNYEYE